MNETVKKSWRPGLMTWLIVGGLLLINASVIFSGRDDPQATQKFWPYFNPYQWPEWYSTNLWLVFTGLLAVTILKKHNIQKALHLFYSSHFWKFAKTRFKKSKPNQVIVRFLLHKKTGKWLLRQWVFFWKSIRVERYPFYAWVFTFLAIFIVFFRCAAVMEMPRLYLLICWVFPRHFIYNSIYEPFFLVPLIDFNMSGKITWRLFIAPATGLLLIIWLLRIASKSKKKGKKP